VGYGFTHEDPGWTDFYGDRLLIASPLAVVYAIREHDRLAEVISAIRVEEPRL
jgi:hypothetical protein